MRQSTTDDSFNPTLQTWDDVDRWLLAEAREAADLRITPDPTAVVLHGGVTTLVIRTPPLSADAEQVGRALAHMIHPLRPDQVLVTFPGSTRDRQVGRLYAMAGERGHAWRHLQLPVPYFDPRTEIALTTVARPHHWTTYIRPVFDEDAPPPPEVSKVRHLDEEFIVAVNPDGPAAAMASRWPAA